jgi:hypothetical protein
MKKRLVQQGDSLEWAPDEAMLDKLRWFLGDVTDTQGKWTEKALPVPYQGPGSGSCGIISLSVIQAFADPNVMPWSLEMASKFRHNWLRELLLHHLTAIRSLAKVSYHLLTRQSG